MNLFTIAKRIKHARTELGLTQKELGQKLNVTQAMIGKWEAMPANWDPKISTVSRLAKALKVDVAWLLFGIEAGKPARHA